MHQSMPRFARLLADGLQARGHYVEMRAPKAVFVRLPLPGVLRKWLGYLDQYLIFPIKMQRILKRYSANTLFVFADQALGPWVPLVANRPHVIHCHDFLAQFSALGKISEHTTSWTGKQYQAFIRRGYSKGTSFISVSRKTQADLHSSLPKLPQQSEVVYNALNQNFTPSTPDIARILVGERTGLALLPGYLLHVGGNQWYKNRRGVIEIYTAWRASQKITLPLLLIGSPPDDSLRQAHAQSPYAQDIHLLTEAEDELVRLAYAGATAFLFPSLAEGFGWPIAEAMASGCPVITTQAPPMTEVGDNAAFYIPRRPATQHAAAWAMAGAQAVQKVVALAEDQRQAVIAAGLANANRFEPAQALDQIEAIYQRILTAYSPA